MQKQISSDLYEAIKETANGLGEVKCDVKIGEHTDKDGKPCFGLFGSEGALQSFAFSFGLAHTDMKSKPDAVYKEFRKMLPNGDMADTENGKVWFFQSYIRPQICEA